jgi:hypothetical protein
MGGDLVGGMFGGEAGGLLVAELGRDTALLPWGTFAAALVGALGMIVVVRAIGDADSAP